MIFLLDENLPPSLCSGIALIGYKSRHVKEAGLLSAPDEKIFNFAQSSGEIIITHDLDFSRIHALSGAKNPSIILFRIEPLNPEIILDFLRNSLHQIKEDIETGAFVVVENDQIRVRKLPIK